ncbi:hypothetical protein Ciccas_010684, partial [Cichlidogyrus casuarinus]
QFDASEFRCICTIKSLNRSINLTNLGSTTGKGAISFNLDPTWGKIAYNPCYTFKCVQQLLNTAAVCKYQDGKPTRELAYQAEAHGTYYDNGTYAIIYKKIPYDTDIDVTVLFFCDPGEPRAPTIVGSSSDFIVIEWPTRLMCTGPSPTPTPPPPTTHSLSVGYIILLVIIALVIIYLVTGALYNYKIRGLRGVRLIPNSFFCICLGRNGCTLFKTEVGSIN